MGYYRERSPYYDRYRGPPPRRDERDIVRDPPSRCSLLVRNISRDSRVDEIRSMAEKYGKVRDVYMPVDYYTREPKGIGFVEYYNPDDAEEAKYHMDRLQMRGRELQVVFAKQGRKRPDDYRRRGAPPRRSGPYRSPPRRSKRSYSRSPRRRTPSRSPSRSRSRSRSQDGDGGRPARDRSGSPYERDQRDERGPEREDDRRRDYDDRGRDSDTDMDRKKDYDDRDRDERPRDDDERDDPPRRYDDDVDAKQEENGEPRDDYGPDDDDGRD